MVEILGTKRIAILGVLAAVMAAMGGYYYYMLTPNIQKLERDIRRGQSEISTRQSEIDTLKQELAELEKQKGTYEGLQKIGFFNVQDRVMARERFERMQKASRVLSARYAISPAKIEEEEKKSNSYSAIDDGSENYVVLNSPVQVTLEALDDMDIFSFLYLVNYSFPGHTTINTMNFNRKEDVTQPLLRRIGNGQPVVMVEGRMELDWRTLVHKDELETIEKLR